MRTRLTEYPVSVTSCCTLAPARYSSARIRATREESQSLIRSLGFLRRDPATGMSVWWRDHADHHMGVLMDPQGPFAAADAMATENQTSKGEPLPYEAPPEGLFLPDQGVPPYRGR